MNKRKGQIIFILIILLSILIISFKFFIKDSQPFGVTILRVSSTSMMPKFKKGDFTMEFFNSAVDVLKTLVVALGAGLGVWGAVNLMEGYGGDNPSAKSQGMKQFMAN